MTRPRPPFATPEVAHAFNAASPDVRPHLLCLRDLIFEEADALSAGPVDESLKWGQPSYAVRHGTPVRLAERKSGGYGIYVACQSSVIADVRPAIGEAVNYDGTRGILFDPAEAPPIDALRLLVRRALTYRRV